MKKQKNALYLDATRLGIACGILWGGYLFIMTLLSMTTGYGMLWISQWIDLYPGYDLSLSGAFVGLIYGFFGGFIALSILGWLYNILRRHD